MIRDNDDDESEFTYSENQIYDSETIEVKSSFSCMNEDEKELKFWKTTESWKEKLNQRTSREKTSIAFGLEEEAKKVYKIQKEHSTENEMEEFYFQRNKENLLPRNNSLPELQKKSSAIQEQ